ncbi:MAG: DUF3127 domain-containing protein [Bacteroidales bacterium]|nr:DUF3127 domain-containing protein [Bacteroidales bacterium]
MEIAGTLIQKMPIASGTGKNGNNWQKQECVIETVDTQYPQKVCFSLWGDKVDQMNSFNLGDRIVVSFDLSSREFNGKWYTDVRAWKVALQGQPQGQPQPQAAAPAQAPSTFTPAAETLPEVNTFSEGAGNDDLPF